MSTFRLTQTNARDLRPGDRLTFACQVTEGEPTVDLHIGPPITSALPDDNYGLTTVVRTANGGQAREQGSLTVVRPDPTDLANPDVWAPVFAGELADG